MNTDLLGLELRLAQAPDSRTREQVVAHALAESPHDPWWLFVAARLVQARAEPAGDALALLVARVKAHLLGEAACPEAVGNEDPDDIISQLPPLSPWAIELLRWVWTREAADALAVSRAEAIDQEPHRARSLINRALTLPAPEPADSADGKANAEAATSSDQMRLRWIGDSLWVEALCQSVRVELSVPETDIWSLGKAMEDLSGIAARGEAAMEAGMGLLADIPLAAHVLSQWKLRRNLPEDPRPTRALSHLRARFRKGLPEDLAEVRRLAGDVCGEELYRCEMLRTYLDTQETWRVHEGDLLLPNDVVLAEDNLIIKGDLVCDTWLDTDVVVIVLGSLRCRSVYSRGGLCVVGDLIARGLVLQHYNDWAFEMLGKLSARALVELDKSVQVDRARAVIEYSPWAPLNFPAGVEAGQRNSSAWLAIDPEIDVDEQVDALMAMEHAGLDPLPARPSASVPIAALAKDADACQRAIVEGRITEADAHALLDDPRWAWELVTLLPQALLSHTLLQRLACHAEARVRRAAVARFKAEDRLMFDKAAQDEDTNVRSELALHPACPATLWQGLAQDADAGVRAAWVLGRVTLGTALPPELIEPLARDESAAVRRALALVPHLPDATILQLMVDEDEGVRLRIGRRASQSAVLLERMAEDPSPSVRLALAGMAYDWRAPFDQHPGLARRLREKLVLDADPAVRRAAAFGLTPPFIDAHGERFCNDPVAEVRRLIAGCTRELKLQKRLLTDHDADVRRALAGNPHAHEDVLMELARTLPAGSLFEPDSSLDELALHPRLTEEALRLLHERVSNDHSHLFDDQPLAPLDLVVARLVHDHPYDPGSEEYTAYEGLRSRFPALAVMNEVLAEDASREGWPRRLMEAGIAYPRRWYHRLFFVAGFVALTFSMTFRARRKVAAAQSRGELQPVTDADLDAIAQDMLASSVHDIRCAILGNRRCPPLALADYVRQYLESREEPDPPSDYTIRQVVANPSLSLEAMGQVVAYLCRQDDYELRTGLTRNVSLPEALLTQLLGASSPDVQQAAREGMWRVHGVWVE